MQFIGIDVHTNKFTCCYRDEHSPSEAKKGQWTQTFYFTPSGIDAFCDTLTPETYVLLEATITSFSFARLFQPLVKEVIIANTYELKQISFARTNTDKIDANILCRILKMQILSGEQTISPVYIPPQEIQDLRGLFTTYRLYKKQTTQIKNRIHSLVKEKLYGFTQEEIFSKSKRQMLQNIEQDPALSFQIQDLLALLENIEARIEALKERIFLHAEPYMREIEILTSMKGVSVFIAIAIIVDIITVKRFKNSKAFTSYLRSAPRVSSSNTSTSIRGTNKKGRKLSATLLTQSLNHVLTASPKLNRWYTRLCTYKKPGMVRNGLRRRVFTEIYQMLKKGEYHYARDAKNHEGKMEQYRKFLEKKRNTVQAA